MRSESGSCSIFISRGLLCVALTFMSANTCTAQTHPGSSKQGVSDAPASSGFSIETEMLTYRALESNSEAIACDVAGVIAGSKPDFDHPAENAACAAPVNGNQTTIVLLPFEKSELEDFAQWRASMAELADLQEKASSLGCPKNPNKSGTRAGTSTSSLGSFLSMSPAGPPLALAQSALGLLASEEATTSVGGNIQDLAFINDVARQLKALQIGVVTPSLYDPEGFTAADDNQSPFLASKKRTLLARGCLTAMKRGLDAESGKDRNGANGGKPDDVQKTADVEQAIADIDNYLATFGTNRSTRPTNGGPATKANSGGSAGQPNDKGSDTSSGESAGSSPAANGGVQSSLTAILRADGLAQKLGFHLSPETGKLTEPSAGHYILMVKALESGGSVTGKSNILGTKLRYSGGAVGTYALFSAGGGLACSGNVYDLAGSLPAKHFERDLRNVRLGPKQQVIFRAGGCSLGAAEKSGVLSSNPIQ
jgi:hypothetical protein